MPAANESLIAMPKASRISCCTSFWLGLLVNLLEM